MLDDPYYKRAALRCRPSVEVNAVRAVLTRPRQCALVAALGYRNGYTGRTRRGARRPARSERAEGAAWRERSERP
jgi:hypothetical protein